MARVVVVAPSRERQVGLPADIARRYADIESHARGLRDHLNLQPDEPIDLASLFDTFNGYTISFSNQPAIQVETGVEEMDSEGLTRFDPEKQIMSILLSEPSYRNLIDGKPRARFSFAHEVGHAVLHAAELRRMSKLTVARQAALHRGSRTHAVYKDCEWQANSFAGALLAPAKGIERLEIRRRNVTPQLLANNFGISLAAAQVRLSIYRERRSELISA